MLEATTLLSFQKVTTFVLRDAPDGTELLTFLHPSAGRQIPAGSVEPDEEPQAAAMREVLEETGVSDLRGLTQIGQMDEDLGEQAVALHDTALMDGSGARIDSIQRGHRVAVEAVEDSRLRVTRLVYDFNLDPPKQLLQPVGWAMRDQFARRISRRFYVATATNTDVDRWQQSADGHVFTVEWCALSPELTLIDGQQEWLITYFDKLSAQSAGGTQ